MGNPYPLKANAGKSFQGSIVLGKGFVLEPEEAAALIAKDPRNKDVLFPYLNGDDLNNDPEQKPSRWVINFFDWSEEKARSYPDCFDIVERLVKPERQRWKLDENGNEIIGEYALRNIRAQKWWQHGERASKLYETISQLDQVMVVARISKTLAMCFVQKQTVFADALVVFSNNSFSTFAVMQSTIHNIWAWKYCTTMKADLNYTPGKVFETYPIPKTNVDVEEIGKVYHHFRQKIMFDAKIGLTKLYNLFHNPKHVDEVTSIVQKLRDLHIRLDYEVLNAYGWSDISLKHDFYELEYLPENDRIRLSIHPTARKEILKRLLELNQNLHEIV